MTATRHFWPMHPLCVSSGSGTTISNASTYVAAVYVASKTGAISSVKVPCNFITGTSPVYEARIETVVNGIPSGTLWSAGTSGTFTPVSSAVSTITLSSPATVSLGQTYAVVVRYSSGTIDVSNFAVLLTNTAAFSNMNGTWTQSHLVSVNSGSSYNRNADSYSQLVPYYSDGDTEWLCAGVASTSTWGIAVGGNSFIGTRFIAPMTCDVIGLQGTANVSASHIPNIALTDLAGNVLRSGAAVITGIPSQYNTVLLSSPYQVAEGTEYRLGYTPTSANSQILPYISMYDAAANRAMHGDSYYCWRSSGGTYSDLTTVAPPCTPLFANPVSSGGGGGGSSSARQVNIRGGADQ